MTLPEQAKKICEKVTYVAGDFKLPEAIRGFCPETLETHVEKYHRVLQAFKKQQFKRLLLQNSCRQEYKI